MNNVSSVTLLVVDDQLSGQEFSREDVYRKCIARCANELKSHGIIVFYELCPDYISFCDKLRSAQGQVCVIMDMILESETWEPTMIDSLDTLLEEERLPMILVSERFNESSAIQRANKLAQSCAKNCVPFQMQSWQTFTRASESEPAAKQLATIVYITCTSAAKIGARLVKDLNEPLNILHISDPHFGLNEYSGLRFASLKAQLDDCRLSTADCVVLSGDLTHTGTPHEFGLAQNYLCSLVDNEVALRAPNTKHPLFTYYVPGNHDYNRRIALAANICQSGKTFSLAPAQQPGTDWIYSAAYLPASNFLKSVTAEANDWITTNGFHLDYRLSHVGVIVAQIDLEVHFIEGYKSALSDSDILKRLDSVNSLLIKERREDQCVVVVLHQHETDFWKTNNKNIIEFVTSLASRGPVVLFCGHFHTKCIQAEVSKRLLMIRAAPSVDTNNVPLNQPPYISYIQLGRKEGKVKGAVVNEFSYVDAKWTATGKLEFKYTRKGGWA